MYKYEGIGCIYWHQNSKFLVSFQEAFTRAAESGYGGLGELKDMYYRLREGLGLCKEPSLWGAFPLEPYSHTPQGMPAQQPGMTGQVKEDILTRYAELGVRVCDGIMFFNPALLKLSEFLETPSVFRYIDVTGAARELMLETGTLAFTICQTPVVYRLADGDNVTIYMNDGEAVSMMNLSLNKQISCHLFARDGMINRIEVGGSTNV